MIKPVLAPDEAARRIVAASAAGSATGILFGRERSGLTNDQVALADAAVTFPLNPDFTSLNLAQAVLLVGWEWRKSVMAPPEPETVPPIKPARHARRPRPSLRPSRTRARRGGLLFPAEKRPHMVRSLRNLLTRSGLTHQDVRTLHGVIAAPDPAA